MPRVASTVRQIKFSNAIIHSSQNSDLVASSQVGASSVPAPAQSTPFERRTMDDPIVFSTEEQSPPPEPLTRLFVPIISVDHLSQDYQDLPVDDILALGDQALLCEILPRTMGNMLLQDHSITEPEVIGPLVNNLYSTLNSLKTRRGPCEVLLYLSGHGIDPGNICLVPSAMKPNPTRPTRPEHDLRELEPHEWYKYKYSLEKDAERYLEEFYCKYANAFREYSKPLGFVGGEVYAHHRGFIGVLGVLGLWCHAHHECKGDTYHHLVIVADCCFAGIWGATLKRIMKSDSENLHNYKDCLLNYPVSIQCATYESEASNAGLFTPLWYFLQNADPSDLDQLRASPKREPAVTQHPWYVSTSTVRPSWKFFNDPTLFADLHGAQLKQLEEYVLPAEVRQDNCPPLVWPFIIALASEAQHLQEELEKQLRAVKILEKATEALRASHESQVAHSINTIQQSYARLRDLLFNAIPRSQRPLRHSVLDPKGKKLSIANREQLKKTLQPRDQCERERAIDPGVYVFQGGEGDMSLIVTPGQEHVILIDGTKTAACFKAAWDSILKYLKRITMIFVTHHDEDHTYGIQLLLARYCVEPTGMLPDIRRTIIYMNTRSDFLRKNFKHEEEIEALAKKLDLLVEPFIINRHCLCVDLHMQKDFFLAVLLPRQQLVDDCRVRVPEVGQSTGTVSSRGGTTAANVLSINVVAVWKNRDAYLFTGDAHLADVTEAAQDFLRIHRMESFKYVDVPHHGSANSNVKKVNPEDRGLARIPAEHYLISHCGNHHNPSFQTVKDILKREDYSTLHFLYKERNSKPPVRDPPVRTPPGICCQECGFGHNTTTRNWHCACVNEEEVKDKIKCHYQECFVFFRFID